MFKEVDEVKEGVRAHFASKFEEREEVRPMLKGIHFNSISNEEAATLESPFSDLKIKVAVWSCNGSKSPGPNGFNFYFLRKC